MMELFFFCLYGMLRFGCEVFPTPPDGIVLRQFLLPLTQFLDSHFQPCGAEEATFITLPCGVPPPSNTVLIGRYQYVPKCLGREPADNEGQKAPVLDGQDQVSVLFQRGWSDPSCFGFVNNKVAPPAAPGTLSFPAYEPRSEERR